MKRSEIYRWLTTHQGQKDAPDVKFVKIPNPDYNPKRAAVTGEPQEITVRQVTWQANDGMELSVIDGTPLGQDTTGSDPLPEGEQGPVIDTDYAVVGERKSKPEGPVQTEYQAATSQKELEEARANAAQPGGRWETNAQKEARERAEQDQRLQVEAAQRAARAEERQTAAQESSNEIQRGNLTIAQQREQREAAAANKPQFLSQANTDNPTITYFDPASGQVTSVANPNYDAVKMEAERKRAELTLAIQAGDLDQRQASAEYNQWFQTNVQAPLALAQEERARAADQRAAMQAEEQRQQFAANFGLQSAEFGQRAGQNAAQNELALLPYRAGPAFGEQFSNAINGLAKGGVIGGPSPSAGINFTPDAFQFKRPDIEGIAKKATAAALKHLSPYIPTSGSFPSVSGSMPNVDLSGAPSARGSVNVGAILNQLSPGRYTGPAAPAAAPAPPVEEAPPEEQPAE
jgi:chemotaxis protein histidine kinase CheA